MKNSMKKILFLSCCLLVALAGCEKKKKGSFTVKGYWMHYGDSTARSNEDIIMKVRIYTGFIGTPKLKQIGSGTTDASGHFEILCDWYGSYEQYRFGADDLYDFQPGKGSVMDLDTLYY